MKEMEGLHKLVTQYYSDLLQEGEELSSGTLAAINSFLKNNDIKVDVVEGSPLQDISLKLRDLVSEEAS